MVILGTCVILKYPEMLHMKFLIFVPIETVRTNVMFTFPEDNVMVFGVAMQLLGDFFLSPQVSVILCSFMSGEQTLKC